MTAFARAEKVKGNLTTVIEIRSYNSRYLDISLRVSPGYLLLEDRIKGLGMGADDYVVKPFSPREVVARVKALLRRTKKKSRMSFNNSDLVIDSSSFEALKGGVSVVLTPTEFRLLRCLAEHPEQVFTRLQLVNVILGYDYEGYDRTIDAHVKNIRHKVEDNQKQPAYIKTVHGVGYKFVGSLDED